MSNGYNLREWKPVSDMLESESGLHGANQTIWNMPYFLEGRVTAPDRVEREGNRLHLCWSKKGLDLSIGPETMSVTYKTGIHTSTNSIPSSGSALAKVIDTCVGNGYTQRIAQHFVFKDNDLEFEIRNGLWVKALTRYLTQSEGEVLNFKNELFNTLHKYWCLYQHDRTVFSFGGRNVFRRELQKALLRYYAERIL